MKFTAADGSEVRMASFETRAAALIFFDGCSCRDAARILGSTRSAVARACFDVNAKLKAAGMNPLVAPAKEKTNAPGRTRTMR